MGNRSRGILVDDTDEGWRTAEDAVFAAVYGEIVDIDIFCVLYQHVSGSGAESGSRIAKRSSAH